MIRHNRLDILDVNIDEKETWVQESITVRERKGIKRVSGEVVLDLVEGKLSEIGYVKVGEGLIRLEGKSEEEVQKFIKTNKGVYGKLGKSALVCKYTKYYENGVEQKEREDLVFYMPKVLSKYTDLGLKEKGDHQRAMICDRLVTVKGGVNTVEVGKALITSLEETFKKESENLSYETRGANIKTRLGYSAEKEEKKEGQEQELKISSNVLDGVRSYSVPLV